MSVYVISEKRCRGFILSVPTLDMAKEHIKELYKIDRSLGDYDSERYGVYIREYCPAHEYDCPNYMMGICVLADPKVCSKYKEAEKE